MTRPKWNNYTMLVTNTYTFQVRCNSSDIRTHNRMDKKVYGIAVFTIIAVLLLWRSERLHRVVNIESGTVREINSTGKVHNKLPASWSSTLQGFTVHCCSGLPNTKHWPQQSDVLSDEFILDNSLGIHENAKRRQSSFVDIFQKRKWGGSMSDSDELSASGGESTFSATALVRQTLDCVINDIKYTLRKKLLRILDVPCGDLRWMSVFLRNRTDVEYTGIDIVPDIIKRHRETYSDKPWTFRVHDIVAEPLPASYDLVFSRDMTQHLTNGDTLRVLNHISTSGSHFAMLSTYPRGSSTSHDDTELDLMGPGRGRPQDLESRPYRLTPPICVGQEHRKGYKEFSALWQLPLKQRKSK